MSLTVKPLSSAAAGAVQASIELERAALERVLDSPQFEQLVSSAVNSERVHEAALRLFESDAAKRLVAGFFDSGLFDEFAARLLESDALWDLVDTDRRQPGGHRCDLATGPWLCRPGGRGGPRPVAQRG